AEVGAVQGTDGRRRRVRVHLHEAEAARATGVPVDGEGDADDLAVCCKELLNLLLGSREGQVSYIDSLSQKDISTPARTGNMTAAWRSSHSRQRARGGSDATTKSGLRKPRYDPGYDPT